MKLALLALLVKLALPWEMVVITRALMLLALVMLLALQPPDLLAM
jgi:hypothetical protein